MFTDCNRNICFNNNEFTKGQIIYDGYGAWNLNLFYETDNDVEYVFSKGTYFAIDFINITIDGKKLPVNISYAMQVYDPSINNRRYKLHKVEEENELNFISMHWTRVGTEGIYWQDYTMGMFIHSRGYYIPRESKTLHITYRIILPYPTLTAENLFDKTYKNKIYTREYKMHVDLEELFNSSSFLNP